jgi:hydrogenase maturation protease
MNAVVLGLGNPIRTDDGVGVHAIRELAAERSLPPDIRTIEGGTMGLDLLPSLRGVTHLLALDAVDTGAAPGALSRFADEELANLPINKSVHLLGFADLLGIINLLDGPPQQVILLGLQPKSTDWGTALSAEVEARLRDLVDAACCEISRWHVCSCKRRSLFDGAGNARTNRWRDEWQQQQLYPRAL